MEAVNLIIGIVFLVFFVFGVGYFNRKWYKQGNLPGYDPITGLTSLPDSVQGHIKMEKEGRSIPKGQPVMAAIISISFGLISIWIFSTESIFVALVVASFFFALGAWFLGILAILTIVKDREKRKKYQFIFLGLIVGITLIFMSFFVFHEQDTTNFLKTLGIFLVLLAIPIISLRLQKKNIT